MIADVTILILIMAGPLVLAGVTSRVYAACLIVLSMGIGEHGPTGQSAKVIAV